MSALNNYVDLIKNFLDGNLSASQFSDIYVQRFKVEGGPMDKGLFLLLDELFGDAESFTLNSDLRAENPGFYLDEPALQTKARDILERIRTWHGQQVAA
jgi:hypothetical protein